MTSGTAARRDLFETVRNTYGTLRLAGGEWEFECEPQVKARARRVFAKMSSRASDVLRISDTPENCRDIQWFLQRYPMDIPSADLQYLSGGAARHRELETRLADLLAGVAEVPAIKLAKPARGYQLVAAEACRIRGGLMLADDVGVGKTVSGLLPIAVPENVPAVFVAESHLVRQMEEKLNEFLPDRITHRIRKTQPYELLQDSTRLGLRKEALPDVLVISYHMLRGWAETLGVFARYAVFDECQRLRRPESRIYQAAKYLAGKVSMRMGLSATPIYNYGNEFFWVIDCLLPGVLGTRGEFLREWCGGRDDKAVINDTDDFGDYLRREGIMLRRTRKDVGREIPAVQRIVHTVDCDARVLEDLSGDAIALARTILAHNEQFRGEHRQAAAEFDNMMRQATGIAKAPYVAEFVRLLLESGEKVLLYGWHREVYRIWTERLASYNPLLYTGSESASQKETAKRLFIEDRDRNLTMMSLRAGAGVDGIQKVCRTTVVGELDWSPGVHEQCIGRIARDGQQDPVVAYFLLSEDGADPVMAEVCGVKAEQREGVINPGGPLVERIESGEHHVRRLARELLNQRGEHL